VLHDRDAVRAQLPSLASQTYLNTGACGPLAAPAARALHEWVEHDLSSGRGSLAGFGAVSEQAQLLRAATAPLVGGRASEMALTANTTNGMNVIAWGIDWRLGDEIVMPALEHPGLAVPLANVVRRFGAVLRLVDHGGTGARLVEEVAAVIGPRTRLVALSHVCWSTGALLDVAGVARLAHDAGALVAVDGAQTVGAIPVDAAALGADAYAFPAHKWLLGPGGLGALWVAPGALERIDLTHSGYESGTGHRAGGGITRHPGARRHEVSTLPAPLLPAWRAAIEWLDELGWEWIHERVSTMQARARSALAEIPGVSIITPPGRQAGLVAFTLAGHDPAAACAEMAAGGVIARPLDHPSAMRVATGFFTDDDDIGRLVTAVRAVAMGGGC